MWWVIDLSTFGYIAINQIGTRMAGMWKVVGSISCNALLEELSLVAKCMCKWFIQLFLRFWIQGMACYCTRAVYSVIYILLLQIYQLLSLFQQSSFQYRLTILNGKLKHATHTIDIRHHIFVAVNLQIVMHFGKCCVYLGPCLKVFW